jgi:hypothetical protein
MTREEIEKLDGPELAAAVAVEVMGWREHWESGHSIWMLPGSMNATG